MRTELNEVGRVLVIDEFSSDTPQAFTVCVKNPSDWEEIHNYIIEENEIDGIPNRRISCISEMQCSSKRSVYEMSIDEAEVLRQHPKVEWVVRSSMHNPVVLEQRKYDEKVIPYTFTNRFKQDVNNLRTNDNLTGDPLNYTQWGLSRHSNTTNNFGTTTILGEDIKYSLSGKNVDVVIMDGGVRWDHPEFLKPGVTTFVDKESTRVRDILIHGASEYGINWSNEGLTAPGSGTLANYTVANVLESSSFNGSWHGSHVAGTATGNQFGAAFESNVWSIACIDRSDVGFSDPADGFDYIRVWHKNKPINPVTGRRNPTIVNGSWGFRQFVVWNFPSNATFAYTATFRGASHDGTDIFGSNSYLPAMYYMDKLEFGTVGGSPAFWFEFTSKHATSQTTTDELFDDPDCNDLIVVFSAGNFGNSNGKLDLPGGVDYDNEITSGYTYYGNQFTEDNGAVDEYYNRPGTPAIAHLGQSDAPIIVGAMDSVVLNTGITSERKASYSNTGPAVDVWAAGSTILSPYNSGYQDPRNTSFFNSYLQGTSMSSPNVTGVLACYLESNPSATRVDVRNWLKRHGSVLVESGPGNPFYDQYGNTDPVGAGTSVNYWSDAYGLKASEARVLYNPFANNVIPKISGANITGFLFDQGFSSESSAGSSSVAPVEGGGDSGGGGGEGGGGALSISITSSSFTNGGAIGGAYYITGGNCHPNAANTSPQVSWTVSGDTSGAAGIMCLCTDPDDDNFIHWFVMSIPVESGSISENGSWPSGSSVQTNGWDGVLTSRANGWGGPCPPSQHTYNLWFEILDSENTTLATSNTLTFTAG